MADNGDPPMAEGEEGASEVTVQALEDMTPLVDFLCGMCPFALGGDPHAFRTAVESAETNAMLTAFAQDAGVPVLMVMKTVEEAAADEDGTVAAGVSSIVYSFEVEITPYEDNTTVIVFIKRGEVLEAGRSIFSQLLFLNLGHEKPFETLQQYLRGTFAPLFESLSAGVDRASGSGSGAGGSEDDAKMGISKVKKKLAELELSLRHLQQEVDIPEVKLPIDPEIREVLARCKATGKRMEVEDLGELVGDATYLNALQAGVNRWIAEIQKVTKLKRDPSQGTVVQEISFWMSLDRALHQIVEQLKAKGIEMTLQVLKHAKRFHATVSFESDTHLKPALDTVNNYMLLMKEFPINELLSATELERISEALKDIFNHVKKLRNTRYPIERALKLVEAISRDLMDQLLSVLGGKRLLALPFEEFNRHATACLEVFSVWEELVTGFKEMAREIARQRRDPKEEKLPIRVHAAHAVLQDRIDQLHRFRRQHEELRAVIHKILPRVSNHGGSDFSALEEINMAFEDVRNVDALDVSPDGEETWDIAMENYEARIDKVENQIIAKLRDRLAKAKNANEMFRVFQQFNALFFRPRIRGAIQEYQAQLIARVKEDIKDLQEKFKVPYSHSEASRMSRIRDLPPLAGAIIWARQIEMQLATYMSRVETVLGRGWEQHVEGQRLKQDSDSFKRKLNTQMIFDNWVKETESRNYEVIGRIFYILKKQGVLSLHVNFDEQVITLFKEVRNLQALGFRVPFNVQLVSSRAQQVYPFAVSLMETIRTYKRTCEKVNPSIEPLLAAYKAEVQTLIGQGFQLHWESHKLDAYVNSIAELIFHFEEKVDDLLVKCEQIDAAVEALSGCALKEDVLGETLAKIQAIVDELNLETFSNLDGWVENLDARVEEALTTRLAEAVTVWVDEFHNENPDDVDLGGDGKNTRKGVSMRSTRGRGGRRNGGGDDGANGGDKGHPTVSRSDMVVGGRPAMQTIVHEIAIRNQLMYLNPPLEAARADWIEQLNTWLGLICALPRIQSNRFDVLNAGLPKIQTYASLLTRLPEGFLQGAYSAIEEQLAEVKSYVGVWLQYQALWDMDTNSVFATLGEDLGKWSQLLIEIRKARSTFDNSETQKHFGPIIVDYEQVQAKVNNKYDAWHKLVLSNFGTELGGRMVNFHETISDARVELEKHAIETVSTQEAVAFIIKVQEMKRNLKGWTDDVETYRSGQRLLERQRFQFPRDWLYFDNVEGEWSAFNEILSRKDRSIQNQIPMLQQKIVAEDRIIDEKLQAITTEWHQNKPVSGSLNPSEAMNVISIYDGRISRLNEEYQQIRLAKEALDLEADDTDALADLREELGDLKGVWSELSTVCTQIEDLKATPWTAVLGKKLRASLHNLIDQLKAMPNRMRQYEAWDHVQNTINDYLKANAIVMDLKSDGIKERHWKLLKQNLGTSWRIADLTLGDIWEVDLLANEQAIREVITVAQGEMALEEFLRQVKEFWQAFELELVQYQRKCMLIKGWDDLFNKVLEHLSSLSAMKASPYYKPFAEEADTWDEKLNRVRNIFDLWIDVQRRWVYLSGIFSGSADIQVLLPQESSRFKTIDQEFVALMRKVAKDPMILQVIAIKGLEKSLERTADLLTKIQKALGEYLERQRSAFPRFYFVGDEDLLEIIGNSKDINKIQKHLKKMFAGLSSLMLEEDDDGVVLGMASATGEEVPFHEPVNLAEHPKIHEMLSAIEEQMKISLAFLLSDAVIEMREFFNEDALDSDHLFEWIDHYPDQLLTLAAQAIWTENTERALPASNVDGAFTPGPLNAMLARIVETLEIFADAVLGDLPAIKRKKYEHLMMELIHQRDTVREQIANEVRSLDSFDWLYQMRFYFNENTEDPQERLVIRMANTEFFYGFEYLGVKDKLVHTPLTNRCYTTLTQALNSKMGGSPFGPAGTGKTESVKMLGAQLGRFVLVFCCDENFDFQAMGRIFVGLCQVGAWGCFDEFNRLTERILSAVSQQIQTMQLALSAGRKEVELLGKNVKLNPNIGVFITMNPGYAGRSNLPDNLKQLFRSIAMTAPDKELIAQVMLFSQGFKSAERLSNKVVPLFRLCKEQLSSQSHYDFGLRSLKSVLVSAGNIKRKRRTQPVVGEEDLSLQDSEQSVLIQSVCETLIPKLVSQDIPLLRSLMGDVFPGVQLPDMEMAALKAEIEALCTERNLVFGDLWVSKCLQLNQITHLNHGLMLVGPSGSGKSTAWNVLLKALENLDGVEGVAYVLDPKAISVRELYGSMDPTTREWSDGLFTGILRAIIDNVRGEAQKRHWIIFDGDVDPEWVENMNSLLDDNKLLTLPNGERLALPDNVRIMFEVSDLLHATPATVSRCGMVWFSEETVTLDMIFQRYLMEVRNVPIKALLEEEEEFQHAHIDLDSPPPRMLLQRKIASQLEQYFAPGGLVDLALERSSTLDHVMDWTRLRVLGSVFSLINKGIGNIHEYNLNHPDFMLDDGVVTKYMSKVLIFSLTWAFSGSCKIYIREEFSEWLKGVTDIEMPAGPVIDFEVDIESGEWAPWVNKVPHVDVDPESMGTAIIPTLDTVRHVEVLYAWLADHKPLLLCGPPGSGKTMTLFSTLRKATEYDVCAINFSSSTSPELVLTTLEQKCEVRRTADGLVMQPAAFGKWLVVFCDEINLPEPDKYETQVVITFIRQLIEQGGYYRPKDLQWVSLHRIQFVGACNPPTDPGRTPLSHRFLRHAPLILCDYPAYASLTQIYGTFNRSLLKKFPEVSNSADALTECMVSFYTASQKKFTPEIQQHYIYSPRELTRWVRGIYDAIKPLASITETELVRLWAHEGLRLFGDRLVTDEERAWTNEHIDQVARDNFPDLDDEALRRPILFSNWLSDNYESVEREDLREYVHEKLKTFYEEELDVPLVLFNEVLDNVLIIDRVFQQKQGHVLLIGQSGAGKTVLSRFVAWMNGLSVFQIRASQKYSGEDFDNDLRTILRRSGAEKEKICFIFDESNIKDTGFLERMNTLLANGEIPGLFEDDDYSQLMNQCKVESQHEGKMLDSEEELYEWFTNQIMRNLHVVFTMNPAGGGFENRTSTSPALFNRCVLNWFGDWPASALFQVALEFTANIDLELETYEVPQFFPAAFPECPQPPTYRVAVMNAMVSIHNLVDEANKKLAKRQGRLNYVTPRHYLDLINHYLRIYDETRNELEEQQNHLNGGLQKLIETEADVQELQGTLASRKIELEAKSAEADLKLKQMVKDQQAAEEKKKEGEVIAAELGEKMIEIEAARVKAYADLEAVEPMVQEAAEAVNGIKKKQLDEIRAFANPPKLVKLALESVCVMLGLDKTDWTSIRKFSKKDGFISSIVNYDPEALDPRTRSLMQRKYLANPDYTFEKINNASRACGPLCKWASAVVQYAEVLETVEPLRAELQRLEDDAAVSQARSDEVNAMVAELEESLERYTKEYADLIAETTRISTEMETTRVKVDRSSALLASLSEERVRWESESQNFQSQMATVVGDVLICSAFMAYSGFFDQQYRSMLLRQWQKVLTESNIAFKEDLSIVNFLSIPDDRLQWQENALPDDDLCSENAIMISRFNRYPLLIDPSGQATEFVMNQYADKKIKKTSFLDKGFLKALESSLRFGTPILVQDVENVDPIVNPILNRELRRAGGRVLMSLGDQDIDFSPAFMMIMTTRDPTFNFAPDLCSRVTFVNFTVTPSSLQNQCLSRVLKQERPDIDKKRSDLIKLQGEFRVKLRQLEDRLLKTLSESEGNILDNDTVIATLETLKQETSEIQAKVAETEEVMVEIQTVSAQYEPMAASCSRIYFALEQLANIGFLYQFSLNFFLSIFEEVLMHNSNLEGVEDPMERLSILVRDLFAVVFERVARALKHEDQLPIAIIFAQIRLEADHDDIPPVDFDFFLKGTTHAPETPALPACFNALAGKRIAALTTLTSFRELANHMGNNEAAWEEVARAHKPELRIPPCWETGGTEQSEAIVRWKELLVVKAIRPDRILAASTRLINTVFGPEFLDIPPLDMAQIVDVEQSADTPILLVSQPGFDASGYVDELATAERKQCKSVSIGSPEGFELAEKAIAQASKAGTWVMLKNVHLAPQWLVELEKKLHGLSTVPNFRLFLTSELNPSVPVNLLRMSRILMFEPPPGVKANLLRSFSKIPASRMDAEPTERARLYFAVTWLHAIVQERMQYRPLGWAQAYEFNDADQRCGLDAIDYWIASVAGDRSNVAPEKIPWDALRTLTGQSIYGGKIDNVFDQALLESFLSQLFAASLYDADYQLVHADGDSAAIVAPEARKKAEFLSWIQSLPDTQTPAWLGLPSNAELVLLSNQGNQMVVKVLNMQSMADDDDDSASQESSALSTDTRPAWMRSLHTQVRAWAGMLPEEINLLAVDEDKIRNPLFRCIEREIRVGAALLSDIHRDLGHLDLVCQGEMKQTNHIRMLLATLSKGVIPKTWREEYSVPPTLAVSVFLTDFISRCHQLQSLSASSDYGKSGLKLGELFVPNAFLTASQQYAAQARGWPLEELVLSVQIGETDLDDQSFLMQGLQLQGGDFEGGNLVLSQEMMTHLPDLRFRWINVSEMGDRAGQVKLPVYLNEARTSLQFEVYVPAGSLDDETVYERGLAILLTDYTNMAA